MHTLFFNKYINGEKDLTYKESDRKDLDYYTQRLFADHEYNKIVEMSLEEVKRLIDKII